MPCYYYLRRCTEHYRGFGKGEQDFNYTTIGPATDITTILDTTLWRYQITSLTIDGVKFKKNSANTSFDQLFSKRKHSKQIWYLIVTRDIIQHDDTIAYSGRDESSFRY